MWFHHNLLHVCIHTHICYSWTHELSEKRLSNECIGREIYSFTIKWVWHSLTFCSSSNCTWPLFHLYIVDHSMWRCPLIFDLNSRLFHFYDSWRWTDELRPRQSNRFLPLFHFQYQIHWSVYYVKCYISTFPPLVRFRLTSNWPFYESI